MTRNVSTNVVSLSHRDWVGLLAIFVTLLSLMLAAYLRHDRYLTETLIRVGYLSEQQTEINERIDKIELRLERINDG